MPKTIQLELRVTGYLINEGEVRVAAVESGPANVVKDRPLTRVYQLDAVLTPQDLGQLRSLLAKIETKVRIDEGHF